MPNIRTNLTRLPQTLARLADELIMARIELSAYYSEVRYALRRAESCGAQHLDVTRAFCQEIAHHPGHHSHDTEWRTWEWLDDQCVLEVHDGWRLSNYAPIGSRVMSGYWGKADDVLAINDGAVVVRDVETGRVRSHLTYLDRRDRVLGPTPVEVEPRDATHRIPYPR